MATLPEVTATLDADVSGFIRAWDEAADAAVRNAARIRAAQQGLGDIGGGGGDGFRDLNAELERMARTARQATDSLRELGNSSRDAGGGVDELGEAARNAGGALGGGGGGGLGGGMAKSGAAARVMAAALAVVGSILPAVAAAALAAGAAVVGLGVAGAVIAGGWKGISQAGEQLKNTLGGLQKQLESTFRAGLSQEFTKLGHAIAGLDGPLKGIAQSIVGVVKEFTGWIRSAAGMREIEQMLGGVDNMMKSLAPGAKAAAELFTGFGAAAAPAMDEIGAALGGVFEQLKEVVDKGKETGQLEKAFQAGASAIEAFGEILAGVVDILIEMAAAGGEPAADALKKFGQALKDAAPLIGTMFGNLAQLMNILMTVVGWFAKLAKALEPVYRTMNQVNDVVTKFMKEISPDKVDEFGKAIAAFAIKLGVDVKKGVDAAIKAVKEWWTKTTQDVKQGVQKVLQEVKNWWTKTTQDVKQGVQKVLQDVKNWWTKTTQDVKQGVQKVLQSIKDWWNKTVQDVKAGVQKVIDAIKEWWDQVVQDVKDGAQKVIDEVKGMAADVVDALVPWVKDMEDAGKDAGMGMEKGLQSAASPLIATATRIATAALAAMKAALGIRSPSKVFADEVGAMIPAGIAKGIIGNAGAITAAMRLTGLGAVGAGRGAMLGGSPLGRGGGQVLTLQVAGGSDTAVGVMIQRLAQQGKLKITANAVVR